MKFGAQLRNSLNPDWKFHYVDYAGLKKLIKRSLKNGTGTSTEDDEEKFCAALNRDLKDVWGFQAVMVGEIGRRVQHCDDVVEELIAKGVEDPVAWEEAECDINHIISEVNELARYTRLNYSAFVKILKKHDKHTQKPLRDLFMAKLNEKPFYKESYDSIVLQLSRSYDVVRNRGRPTDSGTASGEGGAQNFVRRTTKYWVHPDNVMEVKCIVLKHLPVLLHTAKDDDTADPAVTSIYFDNEQLELYKGRLEKSEGAQAVRLRWYGPITNEEIFLERKTHHEDWTGELSVKERFPLKEKYVNAFLSGDFTVERAAQKMRERGAKSEKEIVAFERLANGLQRTIIEKKLRPTMRSFYNRTAFQLPGDARVRISLDTELSLIREDNWDGASRAGSDWRRRDIGTDFPFSQLPDSDISRFPYAILEVKLQTQHGTEPPRWIQDLTASHLVEEVPKFSKYIHGCATLLESRVSLLPFWLPQMDHDIRKPPTHDFRISRHRLRWGFRDEQDISTKGSSEHSSEGNSDDINRKQLKIPEVTLDMPTVVNETTPLLPRQTSNGNGSYLERVVVARGRRHKDAATRALRSLFRRRSHSQPSSTGSSSGTAEAGPSTGMDPRAAAAAKRIALPTRVEPKVFFANERTFLHWLHFALLLGSLAIGLVNFGDSAGRTAGVLFTFISIGIMLYALAIYQWRAEKIRRRDKGVYDDLVGPVVLAVTLFSAITVNIILKFASLGSL